MITCYMQIMIIDIFSEETKFIFHAILTNICTQSVQIKPTMTVPIAPNKRPEFLNAIGIAKIPVPNELFSKCIKEPVVLIIFS